MERGSIGGKGHRYGVVTSVDGEKLKRRRVVHYDLNEMMQEVGTFRGFEGRVKLCCEVQIVSGKSEE